MTVGIYSIRNKINDKRYVGSSKRLHYRWQGQHCSQLNRGVHRNRHLQNAWVKDGESNFEFTVLEECSLDKLAEREEFWMEFYQSYLKEFGYNSTRLINGRNVMSAEVRFVLSEKMKHRWQDPNYQSARADIMTNTWMVKKNEIRDKMKQRWADPLVREKHADALTDECRRKMRKARIETYLKTARPVCQFTLDGAFVREWRSPQEAILVYGSHVSSVLNGKRRHTKNFVFKYK